MQLPPLSSSSYTVIPEKSFHLCHTYTLSNSGVHTKARAHIHTRVSTHTLTHISFSWILCALSARRPCQHSTTTQHCLTASKSALQLSLQCKAYLFLHKSPSHPFAQSPPSHHGSFKPTYLIQNPRCAQKKKEEKITVTCDSGLWILLPSCS